MAKEKSLESIVLKLQCALGSPRETAPNADSRVPSGNSDPVDLSWGLRNLPFQQESNSVGASDTNGSRATLGEPRRKMRGEQSPGQMMTCKG